MTTKKKTPSKAETFTQAQSEATIAKASGVTVDSAVKKITEVTLSVGRAMADVSQQLQMQVAEFDVIKQAVAMKKVELDELHEKNEVLKSLEELRQQTEEMEESYRAKEAELGVLYDKKAKENEYQFLQLARQKNDELNEKVRTAQIDERNRQDELSRGWAAREAELKASEVEVANLRKAAVEFPATLKAAVDKEVAIVGNVVKRDYEHKMQLLQKDTDTARVVAESTIKSLTTQNADLVEALRQANARIAQSELNIKSIAEKALDSSGAQKTLSELQIMQSSNTNGGRKQA